MHLVATSLLAVVCCFATFAQAAGLAVSDTAHAATFPLLHNERAATIVFDDQDAKVVSIAAHCLADDLNRVGGVQPMLGQAVPSDGSPAVIIGSIDSSRQVRALVNAHKLDVADLRGQWECYKFAIVDGNLFIVGSDRRGAAYGAFELSRTIGVSPWTWWADVTPAHRSEIHLSVTDAARSDPPSVKYRGIFINDEDWGLQPWAAKTLEPETNDIGPKTYARVFELLLRLRANYCWPAMHPSTRAFNHYAENKKVADDYAIVMGSSHCEQMLCNNVDEWDHGTMGDWNPVTNLPLVLRYWEARVRANARFENIYTVGMRGIHDGDMPGGGSVDQKRERLERIIGLQRDMLARYVSSDPAAVPQIFCPYKEVLDIYRDHLKLPDDITVVWPDDNFGYVRQLPDEAERQRSGGNGIYYHLSYWGRPHDYLWLDSTSPALVWREMTRAYELGVRQLWVVNVGDIKPTETNLTLFLELAWNIDRYGPDVQRAFLRDFFTQQFGPKFGDSIADLKDEYFRLCAIRKPEHMGFNRVYPNTPVADSDWSADQRTQVLQRWQALSGRAETLEAQLPEVARDAYFELVEYSACAGAAMVQKALLAEDARRTGSAEAIRLAEAAFSRIKQLTQRYNGVAGGKWRGIMNDHPRDLPVYGRLPTTRPTNAQTRTTARVVTTASASAIVIDATKPIRVQDRRGTGWRVIDGLGPRGAAIAVLPQKDVPTLRTPMAIRKDAVVAEYVLPNIGVGDVSAVVEALPTHPSTPAHDQLVALSIDDGDPVLVHFDDGTDDEGDATWQANVLRGAMEGHATLHIPTGARTLKLWGADAGVVVQRIAILALTTREH